MKKDAPLDALSPRLRAAAGMVPPGARIADVGTDHAYLPMALVQAGICPAALASDVRRGPLDRAIEHIAQAGLSDRIVTRLCDGLAGVEAFAPDTVLICGMGGELIAAILERSDYVRNPGVRLILQPMTMAYKLRRWLGSQGFVIEDETLVREHDRKLYQLIAARCDGIPRTLTPAELYLGPVNLQKWADFRKNGIQTPQNGADLLPELARSCLFALTKRLQGLETSARDVAELQTVREVIADIEIKGKEVGL